MPSLFLFISMAMVLSVVLALIVLMPWFKHNHLKSSNGGVISFANAGDDKLLNLNIEVFKQRLAELDNDFQEQTIDQATYATQKLALERQLLEISDSQETSTFSPNWKSRLIMLVWLPVLMAMAYMMIGDRTPVYKLWQAQDSVGQVADDLLTGKIESPPEWATKDSTGLVSALQTNVYRHADDPIRWFRLAEVFTALQSPESAMEALSRAYRLNPDDAQVAITYAQTSFFGQNGNLDNMARDVLAHLLAQEPHHQGAQMLMAMGEMRAGNYTESRRWVDILKTEISSKSGDHSKALQSLNELEKTIDEREAQGKNAITVKVKATTEMLGQIKKGDTLFVSIRNIAGGPPVAAKKLSADSLTKDGSTVAISDNDSVMPTQKLSTTIQAGQPLVVTARISRAGDAMPKSGDITSNPVPLDSKTAQTEVLIDKIVP